MPQRILGFIAAIPLAVALFVIKPLPDIPPWEMWFDSLGMFWGMAMLGSFTLFMVLLLPATVAGALNRLHLVGALCLTFTIVFIAITSWYLCLPVRPDCGWCLIVAFLSAAMSLLPYIVGRSIRLRIRRRRNLAEDA